MFKVVLTFDGTVQKIKYLNCRPESLKELFEIGQSLKTDAELTSALASDPCGD